MGTFTNSEDPDEMSSFHQGLQYLLRLKGSSDKKYSFQMFKYQNLMCWPSWSK